VSTMITDECVNCGQCIRPCPNDGISRGEHKVVLDAALCTECVGFFATMQCAEACPIDGICTPDPNNVETEEALFERAKRIHGDFLQVSALSVKTSRFRATEAQNGRTAEVPTWWGRLVSPFRVSRQGHSGFDEA